MGFGQAIRSVFGKYATFSGRARRSEYWYFYLFSILAGMVAGLLDAVLFSGAATSTAFKGSGGPVAAILNLALLLPSLAVTVRRLHDTGHSGWLILGFIAYAIVAVIVFVVGIGAASAVAGQPNFGTPIAIVGIVLLLGIIAFGIYIFVLMVSNGTPGVNRYGADPKGPSVEVFS
jgi:uncharacterized membrane protein YhaH (DUF805 family)